MHALIVQSCNYTLALCWCDTEHQSKTPPVDQWSFSIFFVDLSMAPFLQIIFCKAWYLLIFLFGEVAEWFGPPPIFLNKVKELLYKVVLWGMVVRLWQILTGLKESPLTLILSLHFIYPFCWRSVQWAVLPDAWWHTFAMDAQCERWAVIGCSLDRSIASWETLQTAHRQWWLLCKDAFSTALLGFCLFWEEGIILCMQNAFCTSSWLTLLIWAWAFC